MPEDQIPTPPAPTLEVCYRHPSVTTRVHCTRCDRPICPECMIPAPVGHQCPECVEQARKEFRRGAAQSLAQGGVSATKVLLYVIGAVFVLEMVTGGPGALMQGPSGRRLLQLGALQPFLIADGQFWRLFSAMFLHAGLLHIGFNAYALWLFGQNVESNYGRTHFVAIYFVSGFLASVTSFAFGPVESVGVGASGAIFGIFGAFIAYNFRRRHLAMAAANLRTAITLIVLNAVLAFSIRGIDWRAHLGGLVAGFLAGTVVEGIGSAAQRRAVRATGLFLLLVVAVGIVVWRTGQIRELPLFEQGVAFFGR